MSFDADILLWMQKNLHNSITDRIFPPITGLGELGILWILCIVAMLCMKKTRRHGVLMAIALIAAACMGNLLLKPLIARPRPYMDFPQIVLLIPPAGGPSFPSGHAISSFACAAVFWHYDRRWGAGAMITAAAIGFSRLFLFMHYPTDVLAGASLGLLIGFLTCMISIKIRR